VPNVVSYAFNINFFDDRDPWIGSGIDNHAVAKDVIRIFDKSAIYFRKSHQLENKMASIDNLKPFSPPRPRLLTAKNGKT